MITNLPDGFWEPVGAKKFESDSQKWVLDGLSGDDDEIYRFTVRHNNHADSRDRIRININDDYKNKNYEAVEAYMSLDYKFGDRKIFTAISTILPQFQQFLERGRGAVPDWKGWEVIHPNWRVIRAAELGYLTFGMPLPGTNALFGDGILLASSGGPRSLIRKCSEQHDNGNLFTLGRYTYKETEEEVTSMTFSSEHKSGLGKGSFIVVERLNFDGVDNL
jgi:hypothetical protein